MTEFTEARDWVDDHLNLDVKEYVNVFPCKGDYVNVFPCDRVYRGAGLGG